MNRSSFGALIAVLALGGIVAVGALVLNGKPATPSTPAGAISGPDIPSPYLAWGGVAIYGGSQSLAVASTTCSIQSPAATSTLLFAAAAVSRSSTGATLQYEWGIGANRYSTTTSLGIGTIASGAQGTVVASTTNANTGDIVDQQLVLAPNSWVNLKVGSTTPTNEAGKCYAQFIALPTS